MIAQGNPHSLIESTTNRKVKQFLTRGGSEQGSTVIPVPALKKHAKDTHIS